jgi:hypothetical protein
MQDIFTGLVTLRPRLAWLILCPLHRFTLSTRHMSGALGSQIVGPPPGEQQQYPQAANVAARGTHHRAPRPYRRLPSARTNSAVLTRPPRAQLAQRGLTPRSTGPATAGHLGPDWGTRYILPVRAKASCLRGPVNSNVRLHNRVF